MADPAARGPVSADVGEGMLEVTIRRTEGNLLYRLVQDEILGTKQATCMSFQLSFIFSQNSVQSYINSSVVMLYSKGAKKVKKETKYKPLEECGGKN